MKKIISIIFTAVLLSGLSLNAFAADKGKPSDVANVKAAALDGSVKLVWDKATDDVGVDGYTVYYGKNPVKKQGDSYEKNVDVKNVLEYTVPGLTNDTKYYFSVIAYDAAGNESANWSKEVSATPVKGAAGASGTSGAAKTDKIAPQVADAEALNNKEVSVVFSEEVVLPKDDPQDAFDIEDQDKFEPLLVTDAKMDEEDKTNKTVILTTSKQKEKTEYKLTVALDIKDKAGNPIVSGTSDTAIFEGSGEEKPVEDEKAPSVTKVEAVDNTHVIVNFDEAIVLSIDPSENFVITADGANGKKLEILGVKLGSNSANVEDASAVITTTAQEKVKYNVKVVGVEDEAGNEVSTTKNSGTFEGVVTAKPDDGKPAGGDIIAPKDVANFVANKVLKAKKYIVSLNWKIPAENKDTKEQLIYRSTDQGKNFSKETSLEANKTEYKVEGLEAGEYWFKITGKDNAGNESKGVIAKIILAKTGPEMIGLVAFSLWAGRKIARRKKRF